MQEENNAFLLLPVLSATLTRLWLAGLAVPVASAGHAGAVGPQAWCLSPESRGAALAELPLVSRWAGAALHPGHGHAGPGASAHDGNVIQVAST